MDYSWTRPFYGQFGAEAHRQGPVGLFVFWPICPFFWQVSHRFPDPDRFFDENSRSQRGRVRAPKLKRWRRVRVHLEPGCMRTVIVSPRPLVRDQVHVMGLWCARHVPGGTRTSAAHKGRHSSPTQDAHILAALDTSVSQGCPNSPQYGFQSSRWRICS